MSIKTFFLVPFIAAVFYGFINPKVCLILNTLVFFYFFYFIYKLNSQKLIFLPPYYKLFFASIFLSLISFIASPLKHLISIEYINFLSGFIIFFLIINLDEEIDYRYIYPFLFFIIAFGMYKSFINNGEIISTFKNANTLAFFSIMIIGLMIEQKKYYMALIFLGLLISTKSISGVMSVMFATIYYTYLNRKFIDFRSNYLIFIIMVVLFAFLIYNIEPASVIDRFRWWKASFNMFISSPFFGWGYSSFAFVSSSFAEDGLKSIYAHNYYLETLSEHGILFSTAWFLFLYNLIKSSTGFYRYTIIALLIHSFFDFGANTLSGWWFFMFFLANSVRKNRLIFKVTEKYANIKRYVILFSIILILGWVAFLWRNFSIELINEKAYKYYKEHDYLSAVEVVNKGLTKYPSSIDLLSTKLFFLEERYSKTRDVLVLKEIAKTYEHILLLNPYYFWIYDKLKVIYGNIDNNSLNELIEREKKYKKW